MPGTFRGFQNCETMGPQPPPVAPKSTGAKFTVQSWQPAAKVPEVEDSVNYGNHVRCSSLDSVDSSSGSSSCSSVGGHFRQLSNDSSDYLAARNLVKTSLANHNPHQFIKSSSPLSKKAEQCIPMTKEVRIKGSTKENEEEWQSNLDNWKSRRRKVSENIIQRAEEMRQIEVEEQIRQLEEQKKKTKTFSEILENRSLKRNYNLDLYMGQGDDSGVGGTPEPEEQDALDSQHLIIRSDTSEGMTSETDSIDSDTHGCEKITKEPPKVPRKPYSRLTKAKFDDLIAQGASNSENTSSAEPSDVEGHVADIEAASSEDDIGFCGPVPNMDSGLESLCDSQRPNDTADSASDLSQDSCGGLEKPLLRNDYGNSFYQTNAKNGKSVEYQNEDDGKLQIIIETTQGQDYKSFGFTISGGKDQTTDAFIENVQEGSLADLAGLKVADKVLSVNGEPTLNFSHSSLIFSIKQASYIGRLELIVLRQPQSCNSKPGETPKQRKDGTSFAQKIALFSGGSVGNQNASSLKTAKDAESKNESLVLKRRSAFEKGPSCNDNATPRRFSFATPEISSCTKSDENERRYSVDLVKCENSAKKLPPPIPTKPRPKTQTQNVSPEFPVRNSVRLNEAPLVIGFETEPRFDIMGNCFEKKTPKPILKQKGFELRVEPEDITNGVTVNPTEQCTEHTYSGHVNSESPICSERLQSSGYNSRESNGTAVVTSHVPPHHVNNSSESNAEDMTDEKKDAALAQIFETIDACVETIANVQISPKDCIDVSFKTSASDEVEEEQHPQHVSRVQIESPEHVGEVDNVFQENFNHELEISVQSDEIAINNDVEQDEIVEAPLSPTGLPLEKVDEDDVFSGCTTSSDTPDTETIIDNYPFNVSPLPDDGASDSAIPFMNRVPSPDLMRPLPEILESISEENSLDVEDSSEQAKDPVYSNDLNGENIELPQDPEDEYNEMDECADQLSPLDVIDQIEMKLMQQLQQEALEDLDDANDKLEEEVNRQLIYLSEDSDLLDELDAPRNAIPPSEPPPPPPPPEPERTVAQPDPFQRTNSTKRIKKEIWRRRSDFLGIDCSEGINIDDIPPPPPGLEELLKSEMESQREQRLLIEKRLSFSEPEYSNIPDPLASTNDSSPECSPTEEYTTQYILEVLNADPIIETTEETQEPDWGIQNECHMPVTDHDNSGVSDLGNNDKGKLPESPQIKAKSNIYSLGAAPKAKIMDSNKWITQAEKHAPLVQVASDPVFREGTYTQNFWVAQDAQKRNSIDRGHAPVDRRYSMPDSYNSKPPNVTLRTWDDRESDYPIPARPKSNVWAEHSAQSFDSSSRSDYYQSQNPAWSENMSNSYEERTEERHLCSYCGQPLTEVSAMGIEALQLYFHIECFRCCVCRLQLGNGMSGTDVQVKNSQLYCPKCFNIE